MERRNLNIGLFGFGCVGQGLYDVLKKTPGLKANIKRICVKDPAKERRVSPRLITFRKTDILHDPEINIVVELIDDAVAAFDIVKTALQNGKAVVTANKKMLAENLEELLQLQRKHKVPLLYEAACCGSIPIIRNLEEYYDTDLLESIQGIVNGSTNYILTKAVEDDLPFAEAFHEAQLKGFAESDPSLDVSGLDARYKLQLLIAHAFGAVVGKDDVFYQGIEDIGPAELKYAREKGYKIKLVARAEKGADGKIHAFVIPSFIGQDDKLYAVDHEFNGIKTKSVFSDEQFFSGKGAGAYPTASAVLSDLSALTYGYKYEYKKLGSTEQLQCPSKIFLKVFLRHLPEEGENIRPLFHQVEESYSNHETAYFTGIITLENLALVAGGKKPGTSVVVIEKLEGFHVAGNGIELERKDEKDYKVFEALQEL